MTVFLLRLRPSKKEACSERKKALPPPSLPPSWRRLLLDSFNYWKFFHASRRRVALQSLVTRHLRIPRGLDVGRHDSFNMAYTYATKDAFITAATFAFPSLPPAARAPRPPRAEGASPSLLLLRGIRCLLGILGMPHIGTNRSSAAATRH